MSWVLSRSQLLFFASKCFPPCLCQAVTTTPSHVPAGSSMEVKEDKCWEKVEVRHTQWSPERPLPTPQYP